MDRRRYFLMTSAWFSRALGVLALAAAGCAPSLMPAAIDRTLDGWGVLIKDSAGVSALAGSSSASVCADVRRTFVKINEPYPVRCQHIHLDMNPLSPNFHVAVGSQPPDGVLVFVGGPTQADCDRIRLGASRSRWSEVPCRPATLIER
jgi:hypothetical protein